MEIHYSVNEEDACSTQPGGSETVGVDKGYTEAYTDSDGERHGKGLGDLLAAESDARKVKGQRRNRMRDLEQKHRDAGNVQKADSIRHNNLGHRKWGRRQKQHNARVRDFLCQAAHSVVDRAGTIACEDLTAPMQSAKVMHRDTQRRLSGWVKGVMADTLISISRRRGTALVLVNPAYTSQIDSRAGLLARSPALGPVLRRGRSRVGRGHQRRPQYPGAHVRRRDHAVHALPRGQTTAPGSKRDNGGDGSTRTRVRIGGPRRLTAESE